ncbi:MAG: phenylalanine--tRNA ligase subunit alpha [Polyangia bacterium]
MTARLRELAQRFLDELEGLDTEQRIRDLQASYLGKKGAVAELQRLLGKIPKEARREVGRAFNEVKGRITSSTREALDALAEREQREYLERHLDLTLPGRAPRRGHMHPIRIAFFDVIDVFVSMGFDVALGPEVETDELNFGKLNFPPDHPARDMQDTLFVREGETLLRTHTSPVQIRALFERPLPVQIVAPGAVYRRDDDPTHSPMFFQVEGLLVDEGIDFSHLKGALETFIRRVFGSDAVTRFRPSFFPFTEPSAEVDVQCIACKGRGCGLCSGTGWLELLGCGMVDPNVLEGVDIDPERYSGFAFGIGVDRIAMLRYEGITSIRLLYENDPRFLGCFRR